MAFTFLAIPFKSPHDFVCNIVHVPCKFDKNFFFLSIPIKPNNCSIIPTDCTCHHASQSKVPHTQNKQYAQYDEDDYVCVYYTWRFSALGDHLFPMQTHGHSWAHFCCEIHDNVSFSLVGHLADVIQSICNGIDLLWCILRGI